MEASIVRLISRKYFVKSGDQSEYKYTNASMIWNQAKDLHKRTEDQSSENLKSAQA
ncbi:uncharacterized protein Bfra_010308 [Botrytis fragariae]|uniref:Uncharacterized protein n=1 Tax=Botrytis fragariae TaxID=1964551 RepID=A0A8H6AMF0_9HELO|nr:uncharacterized protein Bfra_010308 [Botrytis fragariae]KAF5870162.1 hypothetical protein Bfra_010308 [Botrytis fragariae]